jgi:single-strand DNA-binding protein
MSSVNRVIILGNLGKDPELRYTQNQTAVVTLNIATTDSRMVNGQRQDQTEWHRVIVWGKQAESCSKYLTKGRSVFVEGRLQTRSWDDKTGAKRYTTEIVAGMVKFIGGGQRADQGASQGNNAFAGPSGGDDMGHEGDSMGSTGYGGPETPMMDEIPF